MNWTNFQTYNEAPTEAFETLCNQLFENWCKETYDNELSSFRVVNGAGGDGGVESYAVLSDKKMVGLQAKWFTNSINSNQMQQIKNSINTALRVRPTIARYIVCIPRNLGSLTVNSNNTEASRWEKIKNEVLKDYPDLIIDLWDENRLLQELQKQCSAGIFKFWFERGEISEENIEFAFEKSKNSWLKTKYIPELNTFGYIHDSITSYLGTPEWRIKSKKVFEHLRNLCNEFYSESEKLINVCGEVDAQTVMLLNELRKQFQSITNEIENIQLWLSNESIIQATFDENFFGINFFAIISRLKESKASHSHYFHFSAVLKILEQMSNIPIQAELDLLNKGIDRRSILFLGEPGVGKTHGIAAEVDNLLKEGYHVAILIQARDIAVTDTWKDIISSSLGLSNEWSEEEIWQGLMSLASRKKFHALDKSDEVFVLPKIAIFIDGLDESWPYEKWIERVQSTNAIVKKYPLIRFIFTSRPHVFSDNNIEGKIVNIGISGDTATCKLIDRYLKAYNVDISNTEWIKSALNTPLALKIFCEINQDKVVEYHSSADISISALLREKIKLIEIEFCKQVIDATKADQYIFKSILRLANLFKNNSRLKRENLINTLRQELSIELSLAKSIIEYLENYGILHQSCEHENGVLPLDIYYCEPGIQGYFDYAMALMLIDEYERPQDIDFSSCKALEHNAYYILAIISIQKFSFLITDNLSIDATISISFKTELMFLALRFTRKSDGESYKLRLFQMMTENAEILRAITNYIVLPLARESQHPLGVSLLNEFLLSFEFPAERDILWSVPCNLRGSYGDKWYSSSELKLEQDMNFLIDTDTAEGLPTVYAWALSTVNNVMRQNYRIALMKWAIQTPGEFYKLFLKFSSVNDPQIRNDIFSILMSLLFEKDYPELLKASADWLMQNILGLDQIEKNRDIAIRYYSTSIIRKAMDSGVITSKEADNYLPPFNATSTYIELSEEALKGTRMSGYKGITYDLSRYVLIDYLDYYFCDRNRKLDINYNTLIENIAKNQPKYINISSDQFILSAAFQFITSCGWNERDFEYFDVENHKVYGVDFAISQSYNPNTHGSQSSVMTICEKYVWQARNYISGFLSDHILCHENNAAFYVYDYSLLDNFYIPALEIEPLDSERVRNLYSWHIPEMEAVIISGKSNSLDEVKKAVYNSPDITWEKWIQIDNFQQQFPIGEDELLVLSGYSHFEGEAGVETNLYINSILIDEADFDSFIRLVETDINIATSIANPVDWYGGISLNNAITPKEICWMPWKKRYDSSLTNQLPNLNINSAVDECICNFPQIGDVSYDLPSFLIRKILQINNTNGYEFYSDDNKVKAINIIMGEKWNTEQENLLVTRSLLKQLLEKGKKLIWIMRENRRETRKARERFGNFEVDKDYSCIGFFCDEVFYVKQIKNKNRNRNRNTIIND